MNNNVENSQTNTTQPQANSVPLNNGMNNPSMSQPVYSPNFVNNVNNQNVG